METKNSDFYITKGSDFRAVVNVVGVDGERLDLNEMDFYCQCVYEKDFFHQMKIECKIIDSFNGKLELFVPKSVTYELPDGDWIYQLFMIYKVDHSDCVPLEGRIILSKDRYNRA